MSHVPKASRFPARLAGADTAAAKRERAVLRPQRLVAEAARDAARKHTPAGLGLDSAAMRERMVQRLRADGVACEPVLAAFAAVPRHAFVDSALAAQAYEDTSLPIGLAQTISKPSVVARMLEWLFHSARAQRQGHLGRVLEVGTGCGYQAALLAQVAREVVSIERLEPLHRLAVRNLAAASESACTLLWGDGMLGCSAHAPFDHIVAAACGDDIPNAWLTQLAVGGRLVAPTQQAGGRQALLVVDREATGYRRRVGETVQFVPLKSGTI